MNYELILNIYNAENYCVNYIKKLIDKYIIIINNTIYDNKVSIKIIDKNIYLLNEIDDIKDILERVEKHIKNIYPECGMNWDLNFSIKLI
jgi:hypothetical protein